MKTKTFAGLALACAASIALSGCLTSGAASNLAPAIDALAHAGCKGSLTFGAHASTAAGLSPGSANIDNTFNGSCDPAAGQSVIPLSQLSAFLSWQASQVALAPVTPGQVVVPK